MTLMQMKYAIAVADTKSMNEAARSLFITQPSLSASIKELENEIGVELFKRTNRGITVTPEGEEFLGYARQVVEQYRLIESKYIEKENVQQEVQCVHAALFLCCPGLCGNGAPVWDGQV